MVAKSNIQWTDYTWNIAVGCTKVDEDCKYCYMYRDSFNATRYDPMQVKKTKTVFGKPLEIKEPSRIFTSSLTDFFHPEIDSFRAEAWDIIRQCPQHTFQILTKRPERIAECLPADWGNGWDHVWLGTSVGSQDSMVRAILLLKIKAKTRFLSLEPMHTKICLHPEIPDELTGYNGASRVDLLTGRLTDMGRPCGYVGSKIDWVIVGGESGNENGKYKYRPCKTEWILEVVNDCKASHTPVFVKQLGTHLAKELKLTDRHGGNMREWPRNLQVRQYPLIVKIQVTDHLSGCCNAPVYYRKTDDGETFTSTHFCSKCNKWPANAMSEADLKELKELISDPNWISKL